MIQRLEQGAIVEKYTIEGVLGQGGMAIVYRVRHNQLGTPHALKVLTLSSPSIRRRLLLEGQVQARLTHSNIVSVTDVLDLNGSVGLVMEYVEGTDLETLLAQRSLSIQQCDQLAEGIFRGIEMAHLAGLVHRDLKPANILLKAEGHRVVPKVADFGLVKDSAEMSSTRSGVAMGTPRYMSPEQIRDAKTVDHRSDIFSLGCLYYAMVTGKEAFSPNDDDIVAVFMAVYAGDYLPVRELRPEVPERMANAIDKALQTDPADRHTSASAFRGDWFDEPSQEGLWDLAEVTGSFELTESLAPPPHSHTNETYALTPLQTDHTAKPADYSPPHRVRTKPRAPTAIVGAAMVVIAAALCIGLALGAIALLWPQDSPLATTVPPVLAPPPPTVANEIKPPQEPSEEPRATEPATVVHVAKPLPRPARAAPVALTQTLVMPAPTAVDLAPAPIEPSPPAQRPTVQARTTALFRITGARGYLRGAGGDLAPGEVKPGTYAVIAFFDQLPITAAKSISVAAGQEVIVTCKPAFTLCDVVVR